MFYWLVCQLVYNKNWPPNSTTMSIYMYKSLFMYNRWCLWEVTITSIVYRQQKKSSPFVFFATRPNLFCKSASSNLSGQSWRNFIILLYNSDSGLSSRFVEVCRRHISLAINLEKCITVWDLSTFSCTGISSNFSCAELFTALWDYFQLHCTNYNHTGLCLCRTIDF